MEKFHLQILFNLNNNMKYLLMICASFIFYIGQAQDLRQFIPDDAIFVGSINSSNILESVTIAQLDNSKLGKKILDEASDKVGFKIASFNDFGVDTNVNSYFYFASNDSLGYTTLIAPLKNAQFFDHYSEAQDNEVVSKGNFKYLKLSGSQFLAWDNQKLLVIEGNYIDSYFTDYDFSAIEAELAEKGSPEDEYYGTEPILEVPEDAGYDDAGVMHPPVMPADDYQQEAAEEITRDYIPYLYNYQLQLYADSFYEFCESIKEAAKNNDKAAIEDLKYQVEQLQDLASRVDSIAEPDPAALDNYIENKTYYAKIAVEQLKDAAVREQVQTLIDSATFTSADFKIYEYSYDYGYGDYKDYYAEKYALEQKWTENILQVVMAPAGNSILNNKKYLAQYDSKAVVNVWNSNLGGTLSDFYGGISSAIIGYNNSSYDFVDGYGEFSTNLYLEGTKTRIGVDITLSEEFAKKFERMGKQKLNKKFFKYINEDQLLGYMTYKINTKNFLEEYPSILAKTYAPLYGAHYKEEMELGMEFFSLVLDEEAVSKLVNGDVYFGLSGISEKEVTYFDYEYDEDYNYQEIEKTKMEKLPEFILMATTKEESFTNKLVDYLSKKEIVVRENGYYKILDKSSDIPLDLYFVIKNDIFFLTTSSAEISAIVNDSFKSKLSGSHKKMMQAGNFSAFFNGTKFGQEFPFDEGDIPNMKAMRFAAENASDFYLKSSRIKNRKMHTELIMEIPANQKNLINYMMSFVEHF